MGVSQIAVGKGYGSLLVGVGTGVLVALRVAVGVCRVATGVEVHGPAAVAVGPTTVGGVGVCVGKETFVS